MNKSAKNQSANETTEADSAATNYQQPVAYDVHGRPLYAAPVSDTQPPQMVHQVVHVARSSSPVEQEISPETKDRHEDSMQRYEGLNLSEGEYVINAVRRHQIGLLAPIVITGLLILLVIAMMAGYPSMMESMGVYDPPAYSAVLLMGMLCMILFGIGCYVAIWIYMSNAFYLTNESVIQEMQTSVFHRREQTVSLGNIEDASYSQRGVLQSIFNYGSIRLSTEGDETTYRFDYVANPKLQIAILNNAVEAFKNGRPVDG